VAEERRVRAYAYVSNSIALDSWNAIVHNPDVVTINPQTQTGTIHIHAVYNPSPVRQSGRQGFSTLPSLAMAIENSSGQHIVMVDFNIYHPLWTGPDFDHEHLQSQNLTSIVDHHQRPHLFVPFNSRQGRSLLNRRRPFT